MAKHKALKAVTETGQEKYGRVDGTTGRLDDRNDGTKTRRLDAKRVPHDTSPLDWPRQPLFNYVEYHTLLSRVGSAFVAENKTEHRR